MYLRHDDAGNVIYVPEDRPDRDWVPTENVRVTDPVVRRSFINSLTPVKRQTALVRGYIETRVGCDDKAESKACRTFLKAWHALEADGNEMGVELGVVSVVCNKAPGVQFYFYIDGVGPVKWLPVLVTASNDRTTHILREVSPDRSVYVQPSRSRGPVDPDAVPRRRIPPKVETVLVPGKRV